MITVRVQEVGRRKINDAVFSIYSTQEKDAGKLYSKAFKILFHMTEAAFVTLFFHLKSFLASNYRIEDDIIRN